MKKRSRKPHTPQDFEAAAAVDQGAAARRRRENELFKAQWIERNRQANPARRILNPLLGAFLEALRVVTTGGRTGCERNTQQKKEDP